MENASDFNMTLREGFSAVVPRSKYDFKGVCVFDIVILAWVLFDIKGRFNFLTAGDIRFLCDVVRLETVFVRIEK